MDKITITGLVATSPRHLVTAEGLPITTFRLASSVMRFDNESGKWIEGNTNWYTVQAFRQLGINVASSVSKGDRIVLTGTVRIRDWDNGERSGTSVEVEADSIGHDLMFGTSEFTRTHLVKPEPVPA